MRPAFAWLVPVLLLPGALAHATASNKELEARASEMDARLQTVERSSKSLVPMQQQIEAARAELHNLRGQIEQARHELELLRQQQRDHYALDGVRITVNDARIYLYLTSDHFDIISSEPSYPTEASVVGLFTREFYEIAAARLNRGGLFCQWLPYYMLSDEDITMMIRTFGSVFGHVTVWKVIDSMDLIMVGSREAFSFDEKQIKERIKELHPSGSLHFTLSRSTEDVHKIIQDGPNASLNIDDRPMLEFHAARNLLTGVRV